MLWKECKDRTFLFLGALVVSLSLLSNHASAQDKLLRCTGVQETARLTTGNPPDPNTQAKIFTVSRVLLLQFSSATRRILDIEEEVTLPCEDRGRYFACAATGKGDPECLRHEIRYSIDITKASGNVISNTNFVCQTKHTLLQVDARFSGTCSLVESLAPILD